MGASRKWLTAPLLKKSDKSKVGKKWKVWGSSLSGEMGPGWKGFTGSNSGWVRVDDASDSSSSAVWAKTAIVWAQPKDPKTARQEIAAIRIQSVFRRFLARRELRHLKAVVRVQALFRGRQMRKELALIMLRMQAIVRVQAMVTKNY